MDTQVLLATLGHLPCLQLRMDTLQPWTTDQELWITGNLDIMNVIKDC